MTEPLPCPFCGAKPVLLPKNPRREGNAWGAAQCKDRSCPHVQRRYRPWRLSWQWRRRVRRPRCRLPGVHDQEVEPSGVWPHMLHHSCGYYLADRGTDLRTMQDYLGHRDPKHTEHYTRDAGHRFEGLWR